LVGGLRVVMAMNEKQSRETLLKIWNELIDEYFELYSMVRKKYDDELKTTMRILTWKVFEIGDSIKKAKTKRLLYTISYLQNLNENLKKLVNNSGNSKG